MYQLPREFGSFNGLAGLCISVHCVRLGVLWRFSRLVITGVCLFDSLRPINNLSVTQGRVFLG